MARQKYKSRKQNIKTPATAPVAIKASPERDVTRKILNENRLIDFDLKTKLFLFSLLTLYIILSLLKVHTSSIGNWDIVSGKPEAETVIAGTPRYIRLDEWMVATPAVIGQYNAGMPLSNPADGAGTVSYTHLRAH